MVISLFVTHGNEKGQVYDVTGEGVTLGRDLNNEICLTDLETSRKHCQISLNGNSIQIRDLESSNGTFVNGQQVTKSGLKIGDHVSVGQTVFVVLAPSDLSSAVDRMRTSQASGPPQIVNDDRFASQMKSNLQFMYDASLVTSRKEIVPMMDEILSLIFGWVVADRGCILLRDGPRKPLQARSMQYRDPNRQDAKFKISRSIARHVDDNNIGVLSSNLRESEDMKSSQSAIDSGISEVLCVPIRGRNFGLGLIYIDRINSSDEPYFNEEHLKLMHVIAHQAAIAIENGEYYSALLEKERMLAIGETAEKLSHRIKNILQSINGGTHLVENGLGCESIDQIEKGWAIVKRNQERMSKLVLEMLLINNEYFPDRKDTDIQRLVSQLVEEQRAKASSLDVEIDFTIGSGTAIVNVDQAGINTAVGYVISEAVKNSRSVEDAEVKIKVAMVGENVEILVRSAISDVNEQDSEHQASEIFSAAKEFFPGLELSAAKKILRGHRGNLEINNELTHEEYRIWFPTSPSEAFETQTVETRRVEKSTWTRP